jgi:predicted nucleotidyltransferase
VWNRDIKVIQANTGYRKLEDSRGAVMNRARVALPKEKISDFCKRNHIRKLSLFGSVLRDDFGPDSDIDVLVEFEPGHVPGFAMVAMEDELSRLLGRKVDLRTPYDLSRYFRDRVVKEARVEYAKTQP